MWKWNNKAEETFIVPGDIMARSEKPGSVVLTWIVASASVSGVLIAIGFLLDVATQKFLGYEFRESAGVEFYTARGGQFMISAVGELLSWAQDHFVATAAFILVALYLGGAMRSLRGQKGSLTRAATLILAAGITVFQLVHYDLPALRVENVLVRNVGSDPLGSEPGVARANMLYQLHVCARIAEGVRPQAKAREIECTNGRNQYRRSLREWFTHDLVLTVSVGVLLGISLLARVPSRNAGDAAQTQSGEPAPLDLPAGRPANSAPTAYERGQHLRDVLLHALPAVKLPSLVLVSALLLAHAMGLVVVYARTVRVMQGSDVTAWFKTTRESTPGLACGKPAQFAVGAKPHAKDAGNTEHEVAMPGVLLSQMTSAGVAIYNPADDQIWVIPADHLVVIEFHGQKDALEAHFACSLST